MKIFSVYLTVAVALVFSNPLQAKLIVSKEEFLIEGIINRAAGVVSLIPIVPLDSISMDKPPHSAEITTQIINGRFQFTGQLEAPHGFYLKYLRDNETIYTSTFFVVEKGSQQITVDVNNSNPRVDNLTMQSFYKTVFFKRLERWQKDFSWFHAYSDSLKQRYTNHLPDSLSKVIIGIRKNLQEREADQLWPLCESLPTSYYSFWALYNRFTMSGFKPEYDYMFHYFADNIKQSRIGQQLAYQLNKANPLGVGRVFPTVPYKNLLTNHLESIKTKSEYTLLEFWWSGCGICLHHVPSLKKLHSQYSTKGFSIIGISTDKTNRVTYLKTLIKKYQFEWPEYLDENSVVASKIGILSYPTYILLDRSGKIIDNNISLIALTAYLSKELD